LKNVDDLVKVYEVLCEDEFREKAQPKEESQKTNIKYLYFILATAALIITVVLIWQYLPTK